MSAKKFYEIFELEAAAITKRRRKNERPPIVLEQEDRERDDTPIMRPTPNSNVIGLALSGGGIRSSAFCLGALQALNVCGLIEKIDYLSTVSGGGYIGTSMTAAMSTGTAGKFPFASELREKEAAGVQHIRDHSNYLFPQGMLNIFGNVVVYLRGLVANVVLLLPFLLLAAAFTIAANSTAEALKEPDIAGYTVPLFIPATHFRLTLNAILAFVVLLALWAWWRSERPGRNISDVGSGVRIFGLLSFAILVLAFIELQPLLLSGMFADDARGINGQKISKWFQAIAPVLLAVGTILSFLGRFLGDALKRSADRPGLASSAARVAIKLAMYVAGATVPLALWIVYLYLSYWGIQHCVDFDLLLAAHS